MLLEQLLIGGFAAFAGVLTTLIGYDLAFGQMDVLYDKWEARYGIVMICIGVGLLLLVIYWGVTSV